MFENGNRPVLSLLTSHWLSMAGGLLTTLAGVAWLFALSGVTRGHASNPYIGIFLFILVPIVFVLGLALMPIGLWLARRSIRRGSAQLLTQQRSIKRLAGFLIVATLLNLVIMSQLSYRAVEYMEEAGFCGQSCHVMKPEYTAYQISSHARVPCVECHVGSGASGWVKSKVAGTRQLFEVALNTYPRPIPSALETNRMVPASETCQQCHWTNKANGAKLRIIPEYGEDENNTPSRTVLMMMIGGGGTGGIHEAHLGRGISIRYAATDSTRQTIPWVEYRNTNANLTRTYSVGDFKTADTAKLPLYEMQCIDCHNRPAHTFQLPERAVNNAMALGSIPDSLPFIKKYAVAALRTEYASAEDAARRIPAALRDSFAKANPGLAQSRSADIATAANAIVAIYNENVFPDLKVGWGTYVNNLGHTDFPGCFRCHDEAHTSADQKTITQDCKACHEIVAASEASPDILSTLGLKDRIAGLHGK